MAFSALILAGGKGTRSGYREKALIDINGMPLITCVIKRLKNVVDNIIISVRDRAQGELLESRFLSGYKFAYDAYNNLGPLAGIHSGLTACDDEFCLVAACDMPFINEDVVEMLFWKSEHYDAAVPRWNDGLLEPLHAVYRCKPMMMETKKAIERGETVILAPILKLNVNYVGIDEIKKIDPGLRTFMNINTPEDIQKIINNTKI
jgi:molybdopterin-guanine dinucleotide biosynthesis protein A